MNEQHSEFSFLNYKISLSLSGIFWECKNPQNLPGLLDFAFSKIKLQNILEQTQNAGGKLPKKMQHLQKC